MPLHRHVSLSVLSILERALDEASGALVHPEQEVTYAVLGEVFELDFDRPDFSFSFRSRFLAQPDLYGHLYYEGDPTFRFEIEVTVKGWEQYIPDRFIHPDFRSYVADLDVDYPFKYRGEIQIEVEEEQTLYDFILKIVSALCVGIAQQEDTGAVSPMMRMSWFLMALRALKHSDVSLSEREGMHAFDAWIEVSHRAHNVSVKRHHESFHSQPMRIEYVKWCHQPMTTYFLHPWE